MFEWVVVVCRNSSLIMTLLLIVNGNDKFDFDDNGIIKDYGLWYFAQQ